VAGINVTFIGHPFDTLKVRLQTQPQNPPVYNGLLDCFRKTMKWEGIGGLYKGVSSPLAGQILFRAGLFLSFAESKRMLSGNGARKLTMRDMFLAGSIAWGCGTAFECPIDFVKSQMQVQIIRSKSIPGYVMPFKTMIQCAKMVVRTNGITGPYQGVVAHLTRNIPAGSVHLGMFELLREYFAQRNNISTSQLHMGHNLIAGGVGGFLYWFLFYPLDVVKSAIQTDNIVKSQRKYKSTLDCWRQLSKEGWRRFYRGLSPCLIRSVPANAVMLYSVAFLTENIPIE